MDWITKSHDTIERLGGIAHVIGDVLQGIPDASALEEIIEEGSNDEADMIARVESLCIGISDALRKAKHHSDSLFDTLIWKDERERKNDDDDE